MAITGTGTALGDAIVAAVSAANPGMTTAQIDQLKQSWEPVATAIVAHFVANALVTTTDTGTVTSGVGAGGAVVGSGTGGLS